MVTPGAQELVGGTDSNDRKKSTSKGRRWVLRSPGRKPTTEAGDQAKTPANRAPPHPHDPGRPPCEQERQTHSPQQDPSPLKESSVGWSSEHDSKKNGAPRAGECRAATDAGEASAGRFNTPAGTLRSRSRSRSPLFRIRNKMPVLSAGLMLKRFHRKSPKVDGGSRKTTEAYDERRSPKGRTTASCSVDTTSQEAELARHSGGGGNSAAGNALTSPVEDDGGLKVLLSKQCIAAPDETKRCHIHTSYDAGCGGNEKLLDEGKHPENVIERETSRSQDTLGIGEEDILAIKAGRAIPRIAFIGVFLNGVAVALASYAPFGGADARTALIKSLLLKPIAVVRPGGCYTMRGSVLAVHAVVDPKHRVYACITAEDVPFSLGLSLLEEVQIEYISTVATLAFSTKEDTHSARCHAQMARSWAKYERVERTLSRERATRRLLGEDPLDIESPAGISGIYTGANVTTLHFTAQHQAALFKASREIFALEENGGDATNSDRSAADATRLELRHKKTRAALLATGFTGLLAGLYAARHTIFSF